MHSTMSPAEWKPHLPKRPRHGAQESKSPKRPRKLYTPQELDFLEISFAEQPYPDKCNRDCMASRLQVPSKNIQVWFQNRRARERIAQRRCSGKAHDPLVNMRLQLFNPVKAPTTPASENEECDSKHSSSEACISSGQDDTLEVAPTEEPVRTSLRSLSEISNSSFLELLSDGNASFGPTALSPISPSLSFFPECVFWS